MNSIIYRITIICTLFVAFGCKNESTKEAFKNNALSIGNIELVEIKDTLRLDYNGDDLGEDIDFGKNESQYKSLLFKKISLNSESSGDFKKLGYNDKKEFEWIKIKKRINLNSNYNTVILSTLESVYTLLNYNSKDELIDFLDLSKFNQQICQCTSKVYIDKKGVIHCQIESGKPFHPYVNYKVNDKGKFEIVDQFTPPNEEKMSATDRLEYIIKKTTPVSDNVNLKSYLESDEFTTSNTTFIDEKDVENILFSKSHSSDVYKLFHDSIGEYTDDDKGINVLGKVSNGSSLLLICNLSRADQIGIIFILNKNHEITDYKIFSSDHPSADESISGLVKE
ncbi:hypothetical protein [Flavobacterium sp. PL02]|uniref:hypothetical protein n=1 Tax=Flavobacterium sp. PL02 TaxID=3088354 RepID=UPI002B22C9E7|nr:hypothetical protein [Flavobacterium sp. PL02]MEA9415078.1 hypothetical protein [Flavobacterium sp. PL02]